MREPRAFTKMGDLKQPTRQDVINWASKPWREIRVGLLRKSFLVCGISNALNGSQDDLVCDKVPIVDASSTDALDNDDEDDTEDEDADVEDFDPIEDIEDLSQNNCVHIYVYNLLDFSIQQTKY